MVAGAGGNEGMSTMMAGRVAVMARGRGRSSTAAAAVLRLLLPLLLLLPGEVGVMGKTAAATASVLCFSPTDKECPKPAGSDACVLRAPYKIKLIEAVGEVLSIPTSDVQLGRTCDPPADASCGTCELRITVPPMKKQELEDCSADPFPRCQALADAGFAAGDEPTMEPTTMEPTTMEPTTDAPATPAPVDNTTTTTTTATVTGGGGNATVTAGNGGGNGSATPAPTQVATPAPTAAGMVVPLCLDPEGTTPAGRDVCPAGAAAGNCTITLDVASDVLAAVEADARAAGAVVVDAVCASPPTCADGCAISINVPTQEAVDALEACMAVPDKCTNLEGMLLDPPTPAPPTPPPPPTQVSVSICLEPDLADCKGAVDCRITDAYNARLAAAAQADLSTTVTVGPTCDYSGAVCMNGCEAVVEVPQGSPAVGVLEQCAIAPPDCPELVAQNLVPRGPTPEPTPAPTTAPANATATDTTTNTTANPVEKVKMCFTPTVRGCPGTPPCTLEPSYAADISSAGAVDLGAVDPVTAGATCAPDDFCPLGCMVEVSVPPDVKQKAESCAFAPMDCPALQSRGLVAASPASLPTVALCFFPTQAQCAFTAAHQDWCDYEPGTAEAIRAAIMADTPAGLRAVPKINPRCRVDVDMCGEQTCFVSIAVPSDRNDPLTDCSYETAPCTQLVRLGLVPRNPPTDDESWASKWWWVLALAGAALLSSIITAVLLTQSKPAKAIDYEAFQTTRAAVNRRMSAQHRPPPEAPHEYAMEHTTELIHLEEDVDGSSRSLQHKPPTAVPVDDLGGDSDPFIGVGAAGRMFYSQNNGSGGPHVYRPAPSMSPAGAGVHPLYSARASPYTGSPYMKSPPGSFRR